LARSRCVGVEVGFPHSSHPRGAADATDAADT
jgi:hypothetical protein